MEKTIITINPENWCDDEVSVEVKTYANGTQRFCFYDQNFTITKPYTDKIILMDRCELKDEVGNRIALLWGTKAGWDAVESDTKYGLVISDKTPAEAAVKLISNLY